MAEVYIDRGNPEKGQTPKTGGRFGASPRTPLPFDAGWEGGKKN